jgi:hypothetical protein
MGNEQEKRAVSGGKQARSAEAILRTIDQGEVPLSQGMQEYRKTGDLSPLETLYLAVMERQADMQERVLESIRPAFEILAVYVTAVQSGVGIDDVDRGVNAYLQQRALNAKPSEVDLEALRESISAADSRKGRDGQPGVSGESSRSGCLPKFLRPKNK